MKIIKVIDFLCWSIGAVVWPRMAGYYMGLEDSLQNAYVTVTLLCLSFAAWWKIYKWIRNLLYRR